MSKTIPLSRALIWIFLSTLLVSGSATLAWLYFLHLKESRLQSTQYSIHSLIIEHPEKGLRLPSEWIATALNLSTDNPTNLYLLPLEEAEQRLHQFPLIKKATLERLPPQQLRVRYELRQPIARLFDWSSTAIDKEGFLFPLLPEHSLAAEQSQVLFPSIYLGLPESDGTSFRDGKPWGYRIVGKEWELFLQVLESWKKYRTELGHLVQIDVSQAYAESLGKREIVLILEENESGKSQKIQLRLHIKNYERSLDHYKRLKEEKLDQQLLADRASPTDSEEMIVDMRVPGLALIR